MRVKILICLAIALLLVSTLTASASLVKLTFPAIGPAYGTDSGNAGRLLGLVGDIVDDSKVMIAGHGTNVSTADFPDMSSLSKPIDAIPGPEAFLSAMAAPIAPDTPPKDNIYKTLVGMNLTYYNLAGKPMNYTITKDSIGDINRTIYKNKLAWKVRVGQGMSWDLTLDNTGTKILDTKQLFYT